MARITGCFANLVLLFIIKGSLSDKTVEVKLKQGVVIGKVEETLMQGKDYITFRGIPYAAAPVKELRFRPPTPHKGWNDTLEAFEQKPTCMQYSARMRMNEPFGISGSEDCLFINVFTPNHKENLPVVIFDYNDSFKTSFNGTKTYSPDNFVEEDVVVVTVSHRLGLFGYLTTEDDVIPGNNGLRDFIFGLEWVRDNINNFGGDAKKVTLMGSAGSGALVDILLYSEKAKELFSAVIIQSGTAHATSWFYDDSRTKAFELGDKVNIETDDSTILLEELQKVEAETLLEKVAYVLGNVKSEQRNQISVEPFTPIVEKNISDAVLTVFPGNGSIINDVPVIIGFSSREGLDYSSHFLFEPKLLTYTAQENMLQFPIRTGYKFDHDSDIFKEATQEIVNFYLGDKVLDYNAVIEYSVYVNDVIIGYALTDAVKYISRNKESPVFFYMFDYRGQLNENSQYISRHSLYRNQLWGATVLDDLCYLHVCSRIKKTYEQMKGLASEQAEQKVLKRMVRMWTNFAKTGNPTLSGDEILKGFTWEPVSEDILNYLHITKKLQMKINPLGERGEFWDRFLKKYSELSVDGVVKGPEKRDEL